MKAYYLTLLAVSIALFGCHVQKPPPARSTAKPQQATAKGKVAEAPPVAETPAVVSEDTGETPAAEAVAPAAPEPPPSEPEVVPHVERFLLMAQGGPLLVEATLSIDGRPLRDAMAHLVDALVKDADTNGDGSPTWEEVINSPDFKSGRYGNVEANSETETARMVRLYDVNKNGVVDREEVPRFLTRNAGGSRPFSLSSSNEYRGYNQFDSPTIHLLDSNGDGRLDAEEVASAAVRLRSRDADTDDILLPADLAEASLDMTPGQMPNRRRAAPDAGYALDGQTQWDALLDELSELYAYGGNLEASSFPGRPGLFEKLDENADGEVDRDELRRLAEIEPHIKLDVQFGDWALAERPEPEAPAENRRGPRLQLVSLAEELNVDVSSIAEADARIALRLADSELVFFANDAAGADYGAQAQAQINMYDANSDGYLVEEELPNGLPGIATSFEALDGDDDDKLYLDELTEYLRQRAGAALTQIRARAADQADALFTALDADNDGRLETRELDRAPELLLALDADGDGIVASSELPGAMAIGFVRGDPQQGDSLFVLPSSPGEISEGAPAWFRQMDFNGDGEIAAREFLGDLDQFASLDADGDGYLSPAEVAE
jgi:Ca2+-binding EF-hand superfamily protein